MKSHRKVWHSTDTNPRSGFPNVQSCLFFVDWHPKSEWLKRVVQRRGRHLWEGERWRSLLFRMWLPVTYRCLSLGGQNVTFFISLGLIPYRDGLQTGHEKFRLVQYLLFRSDSLTVSGSLWFSCTTDLHFTMGPTRRSFFLSVVTFSTFEVYFRPQMKSHYIIWLQLKNQYCLMIPLYSMVILLFLSLYILRDLLETMKRNLDFHKVLILI